MQCPPPPSLMCIPYHHHPKCVRTMELEVSRNISLSTCLSVYYWHLKGKCSQTKMSPLFFSRIDDDAIIRLWQWSSMKALCCSCYSCSGQLATAWARSNIASSPGTQNYMYGRNKILVSGRKKMASWSFVKVRRKPRNISPCLWCHVDSKSREWIKQKEKDEREREKELFSIKMPACVMGSLRSIVCNIFLAMMVSAFFVWLELGLEMWIEAPKSLKERRRLRRLVRPSDRFLVWAQDVEICWRNYWNKQQHAVCFWNLSYPVEEAGWFSGKPHE